MKQHALKNVSFLAPLLSLSLSVPALAADRTVAEKFSGLISQGLGREVSAQPAKDGVPEAIKAAVIQRYKTNPNSVAGIVKKLSASAKDFSVAWKGYAERKAALLKAEEKAKDLLKKKKFKQAIALLEPEISMVGLDSSGKTPKRAWIATVDAELELVKLLAEAAAKGKKADLAFSLAAEFANRRAVQDETSERLLWLAHTEGKLIRNLSFGQKPEIFNGVDTLAKAKRTAMLQMERMPKGWIHTLPKLGINKIELGNKKSAKSGQWAYLELSPKKINAKTATYKYKGFWVERWDCKFTDKITGIDPLTMEFTYELKCKTKRHPVNYSLKANFKVPPAQWAQKSYRAIPIVGKVKRRGPKWELKEAFVPDLRWMKKRR